MSVTVTSQTDTAMPDEDNQTPPCEVFDTEVWDDPAVCNACFERIRADSGLAAAGEHGHQVEEHDPHGAIRSYPETVFCGECGSESGVARDVPMSRRNALQAARALVARLENADIPVDGRAVREFVRECKTRDELQGRDTEIFRRATAFGVRRARQSDD